MTWLFVIVGVLVLCTALGVFLLFPRVRRASAAPFCHKAYAHRGVHNAACPENSLPAFRAAVSAGYPIELDVQLTRDGIPVVFHDATLSRMCGEEVQGGVIDYTLEELMSFRLGGTEERIPTLREVLSDVDGRVPLLIEIKNDGDGVKTAEQTMTLLKDYSGAFCVESFSPLVLRYLKKQHPDVIRGQLAADFWKEEDPALRKPLYYLIGLLFFNFLARPDFIAHHATAGGLLPLKLTRLFGAYTIAWTVRNENDLALAARHGFDGIIFEDIDPSAYLKD